MEKEKQEAPRDVLIESKPIPSGEPTLLTADDNLKKSDLATAIEDERYEFTAVSFFLT